MILERERIAAPAEVKLPAPASGYFGYTNANLAAQRSDTLEAELFARLGSKTDARLWLARAL